MGKKKQKDEAAEKPIFGSGAEPNPEPKGDGLARCVCTVPCAWHGYHDEGDKVMIDRKLVEGDPFFKAHFKPLDPLPEGQRRQDGEEAANGAGGDGSASGNGDGGTQPQATEHNENGDGANETAAGEGEGAADGNGQGELWLK